MWGLSEDREGLWNGGAILSPSGWKHLLTFMFWGNYNVQSATLWMPTGSSSEQKLRARPLAQVPPPLPPGEGRAAGLRPLHPSWDLGSAAKLSTQGLGRVC